MDTRVALRESRAGSIGIISGMSAGWGGGGGSGEGAEPTPPHMSML